jgi:hypothetical protein
MAPVTRDRDTVPLDVPDDLRGYRLLTWAIEQRVGCYRLGWAFAGVAELLLEELARARLEDDDRPALALASVRRWCLRQQSTDETLEDVRGVGLAIITAAPDAGVIYSAVSYLLAFGLNYDNRPDSDLYEGWLAMQHAGIALASLHRESQAEGMERVVEAFRWSLAEPVVERRPNPPAGPEEDHLTVVETQSPDQEQPWRFAEGFCVDDVPISDITESLDSRLAPGTAVRVRLRIGPGPTVWVGVATRAGRVVKAPPMGRWTEERAWDTAWDGDDPVWMLAVPGPRVSKLVARAALDCARLGRDVLKQAGARKGFDEIAWAIERWSDTSAASPSDSGNLYNAALLTYDLGRRYDLKGRRRARDRGAAGGLWSPRGHGVWAGGLARSRARHRRVELRARTQREAQPRAHGQPQRADGRHRALVGQPRHGHGVLPMSRRRIARTAVSQTDRAVSGLLVRCEPVATPRDVPILLSDGLARAVRRAVEAVQEQTEPIVQRIDAMGLESDWLGEFNDVWLEGLGERLAIIALRSGMRVLGSGNRRCALELAPGLAVKVAQHVEGNDATLQEVWLWQRAEADLARMLMPTLAASEGGLWCIQPLSEGPGQPQHHLFPADVTLVDPSGPYNWGTFCGRPVLLDYE